jgi:cytochrome c
MKKLMVVAGVATLLACSYAYAGERGTPAEAKAMLQKALAHYKEAGRKQALADFTAKKAPFGDRDLYVMCVGSDHTIVANGAYPQYVGASTDLWKDADGKPVGKAIWEVATTKGEGEVRYRWTNPATHKMETKVMFLSKVGEDACGVGAFIPD